MPVISLRELAARLDVSHATVSEALRGSPRVKEATRLRIIAAAERLGYRRNPLASALMTEMRRSRNATFRGTLALLDPETSHRRPSSFEQHAAAIAHGAGRRAEELGFKIDQLSARTRGLCLDKLPDILDARGIRGLFVLPACAPIKLAHLDGTRLATIRADCAFDTPGLDSICTDHARAIALALEELGLLGRQRPNLILGADLGEHHIDAWTTAYHGCFLRRRLGNQAARPHAPLIVRDLDANALMTWVEAGRHDAILSPDAGLLARLRAAWPFAENPPALCLLGLGSDALVSDEASDVTVDLRPHEIGRRGIELLVEQILRPDRDGPPIPIRSLLPPTSVARGIPSPRRPLGLCGAA